MMLTQAQGQVVERPVYAHAGYLSATRNDYHGSRAEALASTSALTVLLVTALVAARGMRRGWRTQVAILLSGIVAVTAIWVAAQRQLSPHLVMTLANLERAVPVLDAYLAQHGRLPEAEELPNLPVPCVSRRPWWYDGWKNPLVLRPLPKPGPDGRRYDLVSEYPSAGERATIHSSWLGRDARLGTADDPEELRSFAEHEGLDLHALRRAMDAWER